MGPRLCPDIYELISKCSGVEEGRQIATVIDVQMRQQNRIDFPQIQAQFSNPQERSRSGIH
jgi:hypothetical protein